MSLATNTTNLATRVATECKALRTLINGKAADLTALTTTAKASLVAAVNELQAEINALGTPIAINDGATNSTSVWSSSKVNTELTNRINAVLNGAPAALDTLTELAAAIGNDANYAATTTAALANRVRVDAAQSLTGPQQAQARTNIGAAASVDLGDPATDFVAAFNAGLV